MKSLKHIFRLAVLTLLITSCKNDRYPDLEDGLYAEFVTNMDTMVAKLYFEKAPVTVANFVALTEGEHPMVSEEYKDKRYYDGITFHRVIDNFMIQGGDPTGTGGGSPGYRFEDEFNTELRHNKAGILSMANAGPGTNGSQFFITEVPTPHLDAFLEDGTLKNCGGPRVSCHAVFGELVKGFKVLDAISNVHIGVRSKPIQDVIIKELNIIRKGFDARRFDAVKTWKNELPLLKEKIKTQQEEAAKVAQEKAEEAARIAKENADIAKEAFLNKNEDEGEVKRFPSGLVMIVTKKGTNVKPRAVDSINMNYAGYLENGRLFDTNWRDIAIDNNIYVEQRDKLGNYSPIKVVYNETASVIPGVREALLNMNVKDKAKVFIPSYLAYGPQGYGSLIPPDSNLVFDLEIESIVE